MNACPSEIELQKLLAEQLTQAEREGVELHVENCTRCQEELDRLVRIAGCQKTEIRDPQADAAQASDLDFSMDT